MTIFSVCNIDGDCEWQGLAESEEAALAAYRKETGISDEDFEGTTAEASFLDETENLSDAEKIAWLNGYGFATEKFVG